MNTTINFPSDDLLRAHGEKQLADLETQPASTVPQAKVLVGVADSTDDIIEDHTEEPEADETATQKVESSKVEPQAKPKAHLVIIDGDKAEPELISWLWPDRVGLRKLTLFSGLPGEAKSLCTIDLAATLSKGSAVFGDGTPNSLPPCDTLFLTTEDEVGDTQLPRFMLAGGDRKCVHWTQSKRGSRYDEKGNKTTADDLIALDEDLELIETALKDNPDIRLVVIDPLSGHLGKISMNKEQEVRRVLTELKNMAERMNVAVIFVLHLNKKADLDAMQRVSGAGAFVAVARSSWIFTTDEEDDELRRMLPLKNNSSPRKGAGLEFRLESTPFTIKGKVGYFPVISWLGATDSKANDALSVKRGGGEKKVDGAEVFLRLTLKDGPRLTEDVEAEAMDRGFSPATLKRARKHLGVQAEKQSDGKWVLFLPTVSEVNA